MADGIEVMESDESMIVDRIYSAILERKLAPNTKLSEAALCKSFDVGRMRVRQALLLLSSQGLVELKSNKGAYVACPDIKEANEVFEARLLIEPAVVSSLCENVSGDQIRKLRQHLSSENAARAKQERGDIIRLTGEFHVELARAQGNPTLIGTLKQLVTRTSLIVGLFGTGRASTCPEDEHETIVDAIEAGDTASAIRQVQAHLVHIREGLDLEQRGSDPSDIVAILRPGQ